MQDLNCPICLSANIQFFKKNIAPDYDLKVCKNCNVIYANPFKAPTIDFYTEADDLSSIERHTVLFPLPQQHPARNCKELQNGKGKKLLDIGCGNGSFASFASDKGFNILGLDIDENSLRLADSRNLKNTEFRKGLLSDFYNNKNNHGQFDIITMFEVFEHLDNPNDTIEYISKLLKPGGYFIGSLPNINRLKMWDYCMNYELPPYHLTFWTIETWKNYIEAKNFELVAANNNNYYGYISDYFREKSQNKIVRKLFEGIKMIIESPIEKYTNNGAGFMFITKLK
ncbi:MAG: class I SAM-dependent methyltransferase [Chitinophagaceae bacterium]